MGRLQGCRHRAKVTPWTAVAVARVGNHDQVGLYRPETGVVQAEPVHYSGREVLQDNIADPDQILQQTHRSLGPKVQGQASLAPVEGLEGAASLPVQFAGVVVRVGSIEGPGGVHELGLAGVYLDDLRPKVGKISAGVGHGENTAEVGDPDSGQRQIGHATVPPFGPTFHGRSLRQPGFACCHQNAAPWPDTPPESRPRCRRFPECPAAL